MAKLEYNEILPKKTVIIDDDPYIVLSSSTSKKDRQKASNQTKLKNLRTGNVIDRTFHQSEVLREAELEKRTITYLFNKRDEYWFCEAGEPSKRFSLPGAMMDEHVRFLKEKTDVEALVFNDEIIGITIPIKVDLVVTQAAPAVKGNTSSGATKEVILESGAMIQAPLFINQGDIIRVNTESGAYAERVHKGEAV